jgi:two-component system CheB/CheR fusion protein
MPENHAYSVNQSIPSQQSLQQPFAVVVIAIPAGDAKAIALLPDFLRLPSDMAVILFEYGKPRKDAGLSRKAGGVDLLLQPAADARIQLAREGMSVEKDRIYVIPAGAGLEISDDQFVSSMATGRGREKYLPDLLLAGLAYSWGARVIAVLVSDGTSSGLSGSRVVREEGGFAFLLEDRNHHGDGTGAAGASGCVDDTLLPEQLASRVSSLVHYNVYAGRLKKNLEAGQTELSRIYMLLLHKKSFNFSMYRPSDIVIRIIRRMALTGIADPEAYAAYLEKHEQEVSSLCQDLLTAEPGFLFDPGLGQVLEKEVLPRTLSERKGLQPFRIWITGCTVGEMAFSVAIRILEYLEARSPGVPLQVFVTGLNRKALERARAGVFEEAALYYVTPAQRKKFFMMKDGLYHVIRRIKEMCVFATHLLAADPPFSHIDIIITDNIMAYLSDAEQRNVSQSLHYSLNAGGCLVLRGRKPVVGLRQDFFVPLLSMPGVYMRKEVPMSSFFPAGFNHALPNAETEADKILMSGYVPPGMLVDEDLRVVRFYGIASPYLKRPVDHPSLHLLKIVRDEILLELSDLLGQVDRTRQSVSQGGIFLTDREGGPEVTIEVIPIFFAGRKWRLIVIRQREMRQEGSNDDFVIAGVRGRRIEALEKALQKARQQLRSAHQLFRDMQESLQALYEEIQVTNEELQSANMEMQSVNQELRVAMEERGHPVSREEAIEFIAIASHELKTPATSIQAYTQILCEELQQSGGTPAARIAERLNVQVTRLSHLIRDLLDVSQVSHGQVGLRYGFFDIGGLILEVVEDMQVATSIRMVTGEIRPGPEMWGDRERIAQVLVNLLSNAIKYSPESAEVHIHMKISGETVQIIVQDFGIGMSTDTLEKVFDRFYRSNDPLVSQRPGLGLGLYIAADIVRRHGGSITVNSEKGKGSVFTVMLPMGKKE